MTYAFSNGFRLVIPYIDKMRSRVKGAWAGKEAREVNKGPRPDIASFIISRARPVSGSGQ